MVEYPLSKSQKVIVYLISRLQEHVIGRTKLMKLMFLIEHYDPNSKKLVRQHFLGDDYIIYRYGVFSSDVMEDYSELSKMGILNDDYLGSIKLSNPLLDLGSESKSHIDKIIDQFGDKEGYELDDITLKLLGLTKKTKIEHFEEDVIPLIDKGQKKSFLPNIHSLFL